MKNLIFISLVALISLASCSKDECYTCYSIDPNSAFVEVTGIAYTDCDSKNLGFRFFPSDSIMCKLSEL